MLFASAKLFLLFKSLPPISTGFTQICTVAVPELSDKKDERYCLLSCFFFSMNHLTKSFQPITKRFKSNTVKKPNYFSQASWYKKLPLIMIISLLCQFLLIVTFVQVCYVTSVHDMFDLLNKGVSYDFRREIKSH